MVADMTAPDALDDLWFVGWSTVGVACRCGGNGATSGAPAPTESTDQVDPTRGDEGTDPAPNRTDGSPSCQTVGITMRSMTQCAVARPPDVVHRIRSLLHLGLPVAAVEALLPAPCMTGLRSSRARSCGRCCAPGSTASTRPQRIWLGAVCGHRRAREVRRRRSVGHPAHRRPTR